MISKGSRFGVGSLIRGRALRGPQGGKRSSMPIFSTCLPSAQFHLYALLMQQVQHYRPDDYAIDFSQGNEQALAWFFNEYYAALCIAASHYVHNIEIAKEIVSEAFYKTWQYRQQFEKAASVRAYLYTVVRNDAARYIKDQSLRGTTLQNITLVKVTEDNIFDTIVKAETARHLHKAIATLPRQCRKIFELLYIKGKTVPEVAKELKLAPSTVRAHKVRGLNALRRIVISSLILLLCKLFL